MSTFHLRGFLALRPISSLHYVPISYTLASTKREVPVRSADPSWNLAPLRRPAGGHNPFGPRGIPAATDHEGNPGIAEPSEAGRAVFPLRRRQRPRLHLGTGAAAPRGEVGRMGRCGRRRADAPMPAETPVDPG